MRAMKIDNGSLRRIFFVLFDVIKKQLKDEKYPKFLPESVGLINSRKVKFKLGENAENLRECLKSFGDLMYRTATGRSALERESYQIDPEVEAIDTDLWPAISLMISGDALSIPQVEKMVKKESAIWQAVKNLFKKREKKENEKAKFSASGAREKLSGFWSRNGIKILNISFWICLIHYVITAILSIIFKTPLDYWLDFVIIVVCFSPTSIIFVETLKKDPTAERMLTGILLLLFFNIVLTFNIFLYLGSDGEDYLKLVDRKSGEIVAYLPSVDPKLLEGFEVYDKHYINHFKYKIVKHKLSSVGTIGYQVELFFTDEKNRTPRQNFSAGLQYEIPLDYIIELENQNTVKSNSDILEDIETELQKNIEPKMQEAYLGAIKNLPEFKMSGLDAFFANGEYADYINSLRNEIRTKLTTAFKEELEKMDYPIKLKVVE